MQRSIRPGYRLLGYLLVLLLASCVVLAVFAGLEYVWNKSKGTGRS